jgi:hypothetical protein
MVEHSSVTKWSLTALLQSVALDVERSLADARALIGHEGEKGGASEEVWRSLLRKHLPLRYQVDTGFIVDSVGKFSEQIDIIIFDRQYSPLVFELGNRRIFPAESVYAVFEAKQSANAQNVAAAKRKARTVRDLKRTSLPIVGLEGHSIPKKLQPILGGLLALDSDWRPPFGTAFAKALQSGAQHEILDVGCVASHGIIQVRESGAILHKCNHAATTFLLDLVARLQQLGTVPMVDMSAYARHLKTSSGND